MSNEIYTLTLNSDEKDYGTNNNATFYVSMNNLLDERWQVYSMQTIFISEAGYYRDTIYWKLGSAKLYVDLENTSSNTYDTKKMVNSPFVGCVYRMHDTNNYTSSHSIFKGDLITIPSRTISNPSQCNRINVSLFSLAGDALTDTTVTGSTLASDMGRWTMQLVFTPVS